MAASFAHILGHVVRLKDYIFGPRLFRIFRSSGGNAGREYEMNNLEYFSDAFLRTLSYAISLSIYSSPLLAYYAFRKGMITAGQVVYMSKFLLTLASSVAVAYIVRGIGRYTNPDYNRFLGILLVAKNKPEERALLQTYDFEFSAWPIDFRWDESKLQRSNFVNESTKNVRHHSIIDKILQLPIEAFDYFVAHGFGRPMIFPGSVKMLQNAMFQPLTSGRAVLIEKNGRRAKVLTRDAIEIDTMFLDRRNIETNGDILVISSEGNAGFYEVGCMVTPRNAGYSVLGWNHPGFAGSSGLPSPQTEQSAIEAVIMYAVTRLGFSLNNIILFAWSIGGYASSYAAMAFPDLKAVIIDASFDDIIPLAEAKMPALINGIATRVVQNYFPLNNVQYLVRYPGPIKLIRRFQEEIITTQPYNPATNRGNFLLLQLLKYRYPHIMSDQSLQVVLDFLSAADFNSQAAVKMSFGYDEALCEDVLRNYYAGRWPVFPSPVGQEWDVEIRIQVALFLATKYMAHFDATHCTPLPTSYFQMPWNHQ